MTIHHDHAATIWAALPAKDQQSYREASLLNRTAWADYHLPSTHDALYLVSVRRALDAIAGVTMVAQIREATEPDLIEWAESYIPDNEWSGYPHHWARTQLAFFGDAVRDPTESFLEETRTRFLAYHAAKSAEQALTPINHDYSSDPAAGIF